MIRILTDSSSGLLEEEAAKLGLELVFLPVTFEDGEYLDTKTINVETFYKKLAESVKKNSLPKTSLVSQETFIEVFEDVKKKGDEMLVLPISKGLSGTYDAAVQAKQQVGYSKIYIIDTDQTICGLVIQIMEAVRLRDSGMKCMDIAAELMRLVPKVKHFASFDTLKYLRAGGRISGASAIVGGVLNVKPIIQVDGGILHNISKQIGARKAHTYILSKYKEFDVDKTRPIILSHAVSPAECAAIAKRIETELGHKVGGLFNITATVGTHTGPGTITYSFFIK